MSRADKVTVADAIKHLQKVPGKPFQSIRETARNTGIAENILRGMQKNGKLPGFPNGKKYIVNVPLLMERLNALSMEGTANEQQ